MRVRLRSLVSAACLGFALAAASPMPLRAGSTPGAAGQDGVVKVKSAYPMAETVARLKADVTAKGIMFFQEIDQAKLAADAGIALRPSTLLIFGNPALGAHFITARAEAGLDWPVRLLVAEDASGQVWACYTDFAWIARRHDITSRAAEFATASSVIASITASVAAE